MNKTENNREIIEILLIVFLTFIIVFLLRSSFNRRSSNIVIKVSDLASVTDYSGNIPDRNRVLGGSVISSSILNRL